MRLKPDWRKPWKNTAWPIFSRPKIHLMLLLDMSTRRELPQKRSKHKLINTSTSCGNVKSCRSEIGNQFSAKTLNDGWTLPLFMVFGVTKQLTWLCLYIVPFSSMYSWCLGVFVQFTITPGPRVEQSEKWATNIPASSWRLCEGICAGFPKTTKRWNQDSF